MSQAPYSWAFTGSCPSCGSPIYGRVRKPGAKFEDRGGDWVSEEQPEARRTCPATCSHGCPVIDVREFPGPSVGEKISQAMRAALDVPNAMIWVPNDLVRSVKWAEGALKPT